MSRPLPGPAYPSVPYRLSSGRGSHPVQPDTAPPPPGKQGDGRGRFTMPAEGIRDSRPRSVGSSVRNTPDLFVTAAKHRAALAETALRDSPHHSRPIPA